LAFEKVTDFGPSGNISDKFSIQQNAPGITPGILKEILFYVYWQGKGFKLRSAGNLSEKKIIPEYDLWHYG
jgi:hypothetical protein